MTAATPSAVFELQSLSGPLEPAQVASLGQVVPDDALREKRLRNLSRAAQVIAAVDHGGPAGVVFVRTIGGIGNVTWLVAPRAQRQGLAVRMLSRLQQDWRLLTAICRNEPSVAVARRAGFMLAGPFALWIRWSRA